MVKITSFIKMKETKDSQNKFLKLRNENCLKIQYLSIEYGFEYYYSVVPKKTYCSTIASSC